MALDNNLYSACTQSSWELPPKTTATGKMQQVLLLEWLVQLPVACRSALRKVAPRHALVKKKNEADVLSSFSTVTLETPLDCCTGCKLFDVVFSWLPVIDM